MMKTFKLAAFAAVAGVIGLIGYHSNSESHEFTDLEMENIKALTEDEPSDSGSNSGSSSGSSSGGCHDINGYVAFSSKDGGAYNCCGIWIYKSPLTVEGHCK
jgi:hypothetical protein